MRAPVFVGEAARAARRRGRVLLGAASDLVLLAVVTVAIGRYCQGFTGFPKGYDAWGHLSKARMLRDGFPAVNWNEEWYAGQPAFLGSYPPGYHVLLVALSEVTGWTLPHTMVVLGAAAVIGLVVGCYLLVTGTTGSRVAALLSATLLLASPTMWDQVVELGLYPRFTALSLGALAGGCAALYRRRPTRPRAVATVVVLASALGTHPVSGGIACGVVGLLLVCATSPGLVARVRRAVLVLAAAGALCGWFYVPLVLMPRSQSALTDVEVPLGWAELGWPSRDHLSTLPPGMLVAVAVAALAVALTRLAPTARRRQGSRIREALPLGSPVPGGGAVISGAVLDARMAWRVQRGRRLPRGADLLVAAGLTLASLLAVAYGLIGHVVDHFTYYVNGLQPRDLLVYPAWLLSAALGTTAHVLVHRRRRAVRVVTAVTSAVLVGTCLALTVTLLPSGVRDSSGAQTDAMIALLPPAAHGNDEYRIAGVSDGTSRWINAVTDTGQLRGYDDHGNLHLDWQYWIEQTLTAAPVPTTAAQRRFLLDFYAARWLLTDSRQATGNLAADPAFTHLGREQVYADVSAWEYRGAHPLTTAVTVPTVLVVGDDAHYDLLLRVLALAGIGPDRLLTVHGPATLAEVTPARLRGRPTVFVYGAEPGDEPDAAVLAGYVAAGGHVVADLADCRSVEAVAGLVGAPVIGSHVVPVSGAWRFGGPDAAAAAAWSPPLYAGSLPWDVRAPTGTVRGDVLLAAGSTPVIVRTTSGTGTVTWSGLNLPYHAAAFSDVEEASYLGTLLGAVPRPAPVTPLLAVRPDPEHRAVTLPPGVDAVLLREYTSEDWHATADGRPVPLWSAGPDMMFVQVPPHTAPVTVRLDYRLSPPERLGVAVSLLALATVLGYAAGGAPPLRRAVTRGFSYVRTTATWPGFRSMTR